MCESNFLRPKKKKKKKKDFWTERKPLCLVCYKLAICLFLRFHLFSALLLVILIPVSFHAANHLDLTSSVGADPVRLLGALNQANAGY